MEAESTPSAQQTDSAPAAKPARKSNDLDSVNFGKLGNAAPIESDDGEVDLKVIPEGENLDPLANEAQEEPEEEEKPEASTSFFKEKLKVNGKEIEVDLDRDGVKLAVQRAYASDEKFQEASEMRKQAQEAFTLLRNEETLPQVLEAMGYDLAALAENYLYSQIEVAKMSPIERENMELKRKLQAQEEFERKQQDSQLKAQKDSQTKELANQMQAEVIEALKQSNLPQTGISVKRMAQVMQVSFQRGFEITPAQAAKIVEKQIVKENQELLSKMGPEKLRQILGEEGVKALRKSDLSQVKNQLAPPMDKSQKAIYKPKSKNFDQAFGEIKSKLR